MMKMRLLLLEDSADLRTLYSLFLRRSGHIVDQAANAEDALVLGTMNHYDAVISDLNLPGLSGFSFISLFRKLRGNDTTPCLAITASGNRKDEALEFGFSDFMQKPVLASQLNERLQQMSASVG
jgi:DNA-binding response OmpR family regulator